MLMSVGIFRRPLGPSGLMRFSRAYSKKPKDVGHYKPNQGLPSKREWDEIKHHIPGEAEQGNDIKSRIPKFPLGKEIVPTLLPRPGVPRVGPNMTFRQVIQILKNKKQPELIYEAEPHRLYFLACFCCSIVFTAYGLVLLEYALFQANKDYDENERELSEPVRKREWLVSLLKNSLFGVAMLTAAVAVAKFPTRLIRRIWFLPGPVESIKFTSYPLVPGRPTPVYTLPKSSLIRKHKSRVWTGKGFYGTADNSLFFFVLQEKETRKHWIVDRKGFFWSDGRVFDFLFGNETLAEAEAGIPYDEQIGILDRELAKKRNQLKQEHGFFWRWKLQAQDMKHDLNSAAKYIGSLSSRKKDKALPSPGTTQSSTPENHINKKPNRNSQ